MTADPRLTGCRALVTGAAMGIGRATAARLARDGAAVGLIDRHADVVETAASITGTGGTAVARVASLTSTAEVDAAVTEIAAELGGLEAVVNNAGITRGDALPGELTELTDPEWDSVHEVNLKGTFRVTRAALPYLRVGGGVVVCLSSIIGSQQGWATRVHYAASKAGVEGFVRALAVETARDCIRVVGIAPGLVESPQTLDSAGPEALREWASGVIPIGFIAQPDDIAALVAFLVSAEGALHHRCHCHGRRRHGRQICQSPARAARRRDGRRPIEEDHVVRLSPEIQDILEGVEKSVSTDLSQSRQLPPSVYTDPAFFEWEREALWFRSWVCVGRVDQIPEPGDYLSVDLMGEPIIVVRDNDGEVRVMSAVCAHRGNTVLTGAGNCGPWIRCSYHFWTYALDGRLVGAPEMNDVVDIEVLRGETRLTAAKVEIWHGYILANFDPKAEPFAPTAARADSEMTAYAVGEMRSTSTVSLTGLPWNWKILQENFLEPYHLTYLHQGSHDFAPPIGPMFPSGNRVRTSCCGTPGSCARTEVSCARAGAGPPSFRSSTGSPTSSAHASPGSRSSRTCSSACAPTWCSVTR